MIDFAFHAVLYLLVAMYVVALAAGAGLMLLAAIVWAPF